MFFESVTPLKIIPIIISLIISLTLVGCQTPTKVTSLPSITAVPEGNIFEQAELAVSTVKNLKAEWLVRDSASDYKQVSLSTLLELAKQHLNDGQTGEANRLAIKVWKLSELAIAQARENSNPIPQY